MNRLTPSLAALLLPSFALAQESAPASLEVTNERNLEGEKVLAICGAFGFGGGLDSLDAETREVQSGTNGFLSLEGELCLGARVTPWLLVSAGAAGEFQSNGDRGLGFGRIGPEFGLSTPWVALSVMPPVLSRSSNPRDGVENSFLDKLPAEKLSLKVFPLAFIDRDSIAAGFYLEGVLGRSDPYGAWDREAYHHPSYANAGGAVGFSFDAPLASLLRKETKAPVSAEVVLAQMAFDFKNEELPLPKKRTLSDAENGDLIQQTEEARKYAGRNAWSSAKMIQDALDRQVPNYPYTREVYVFFAEAARNLGQIDEWYKWLQVIQTLENDDSVKGSLNDLASGFGYVSIDLSSAVPFEISPSFPPFAPAQRASDVETLPKISDDGKFNGFLTAGEYNVTMKNGEVLSFKVAPFDLANPVTQEIKLERNKTSKNKP